MGQMHSQMLLLFILFVSAYASCDEVVRGDFLGNGAQKLVYEGKLGDRDVVIKEAKAKDNMEARFQGYLWLYSEYKVLKTFEVDYPWHSMKIYDFCDSNGTFFYIMERGQALKQDEIHRPALLRMLKRNVKARFKVVATDIKWSQLVSKGDEIYTIDINMGEIYQDLNIDFKEYCRLYTWKLYSSLGDKETFKAIGYPLNEEEWTIENDKWRKMKETLEEENVKTFLDYGRLHHEMNACIESGV